MVKEYRIQATKNDGTLVNFGNAGSNIKTAFNITHAKREQIAIMTFTITDVNEDYISDFTNLNDVQWFVKVDGISESKRFGGEIIEVDPDEDKKTIKFTCRGRNAVLKERLYSGVASNIDLGLHIKNVLQEKAPELDVTGINTSTGIIIDEIKADAIVVFNHFEDLFRENTYKLDVTPDDVVILFNSDKGASGITLSDGIGGNVTKDSNRLRDSSLAIKNSVTVIGGKEVKSAVEDPITWNTGDSTLIALSNAVSDNLVVEFDSVVKTLDTDYELTSDKKFIKLLTITNGQVVDSAFDFTSNVWHKEQDLGAAKVREMKIDDPTILTQARAKNIAITTLAQVAIRQIKGDISSAQIIIAFNWHETLSLVTKRFTGTHTIVGFVETFNEDYEVSFELAQVLDDNTKKILDMLKDIDKLKGADISSATIIDGFFLEDLYDILEELEGFERDRGTRFYWDISNWDSGDTYDIGEGSESQFL